MSGLKLSTSTVATTISPTKKEFSNSYNKKEGAVTATTKKKGGAVL